MISNEKQAKSMKLASLKEYAETYYTPKSRPSMPRLRRFCSRRFAMTPSIRTFILLCSVFVSLSACGGGGGNGGAANSSPTAVISVTKTSGYAPLSVEFDALQSSDRDKSGRR